VQKKIPSHPDLREAAGAYVSQPDSWRWPAEVTPDRRVGTFLPGVHRWSDQALTSTSFSLHSSTRRTFWTQTLVMFDICTVVNFEVICICSTNYVHTWSVHLQIHLSCCVYAGSFMEFQCFEVKPEDEKPSTGMFAGSSEQILYCVLHLLWCCSLFYL